MRWQIPARSELALGQDRDVPANIDRGLERERRERSEDEDFEDRQDSKRVRVGSVGLIASVNTPVAKKTVSWADLGDEEDEEIGEARDYRRCDHCNGLFGSRNVVGRLRDRQGVGSLKSTMRSGADGLATTDETARGRVQDQGPMRGPQCQILKAGKNKH